MQEQLAIEQGLSMSRFFVFRSYRGLPAGFFALVLATACVGAPPKSAAQVNA